MGEKEEFFTKESPEEEVSSEEEAKFRADVKAEIFEGKAPIEESTDKEIDSTNKDDSAIEESQTEEDGSQEEDQEESASQNEGSDKLDKIAKSLNKLTANVNGMENRLKQAERRVGGLNNKLSEAKKASKTTQESPTNKEIDEAAKTDEGWKDLQQNFPDWAKAFEDRIAESRKDLVSKNELESLREELSQSPKEPKSIETRLVGVVHPDWKKVIASPEYREWLENQDSEIMTKAYHGKKAEEAIDVLNKFKAYRDTQTRNSEDTKESEKDKASQKKKDRLESSVVPNKKTKSRKPKAEADMTEEEYRRKVAAELFNT